MRRFSARTDRNQPEIVKAARGVGATVRITAALSDGGGDLIIGYRGFNYSVEVKDGTLPPSGRVLTPKEASFMRDWRGQHGIIESVEQLFMLLGVKS